MPRYCAVLFAAFLFATSACSTRPRHQETEPPNSPRPEGAYGNFSAGIEYIPWFRLNADEDPDERNGGILLDSDLKTGDGYGFFVGRDAWRVGYSRSDHVDRATGEPVDNHLLLFSGDMVNNLASGEHSGLEFRPLLGAAIGFGVVDYRSAFDDLVTGVVDVHTGLGLDLTRHSRITARVGAMIYGYPGETAAYGFYAGITGHMSF